MSKLLLYCTKAKPDLVDMREDYKQEMSINEFHTIDTNERGSCGHTFNGKIVAECDFEVEKIYMATNSFEAWLETKTINEEQLREKSCLRLDDLYNYLDGNIGYAIHIKNLHIFDKQRELSSLKDRSFNVVKKAPQNMMYINCIETGNAVDLTDKILISIKPEWLCKILNGEQTIIVRKKVLRGMLNNE